jgi:hypothetical protein
VSVPTKWQLAQHWYTSAERETFAPMLQDLAAPCCFACDWHSEHWAKATPKASWERATLERAHIVPRSLGGADDPSNVLLLCAPCHRDSPDWCDPSAMARWIAERPDRASKEVEDFADWAKAAQQVPGFQDLLAEYEANPDLPDDVAVQRLVDMLWASTRLASTHNVSLSSGTKVAILRDTVERAAAA